MRQRADDSENVRMFMHLTRLLDQVEQEHPEVSGPLRLTLARSHRRHREGWLDPHRFHDVLVELTCAGTGLESTARGDVS